MRNVVITETELELIHKVIADWFVYHDYGSGWQVQDWHTVYGLKHSLPGVPV